MLDVNRMIVSAKEALGWPYVSPGSNDQSGIDCSGLFVKIYRDQGASIYHGSNKIYRKYCSEKGQLTSASQLLPGMAVFKWKDQQPSNYADNLGDFSHIGLVVSVNPLQIIHASSAAGYVITDTKIGKWAYWGKLKDVNYKDNTQDNKQDNKDGGEPKLVTATVYSENGKPVKMRARPSTASNTYWEVPSGTIVYVLDDGDEWSAIQYGERSGYMMSKFLKIGEVVPGESEKTDGDNIYVSRAELEKIYDILGDLLGLRG